MADVKISALPASGALAAGDLLAVVNGGVTSKATVTQVQTAVTAGFTPASRLINTTSPLAGGGDLSADRTLTIADAAADGATKGAAAFLAADFNSAAGVISIDYTNGQAASAVNKGFLTAADFTTFSSASLPVVDTTAVVKGSGDPTKLLRFEVDGFTAGATRILTPPNANATIAGLQIAQTFTEVQTFTPGDNLIPIVIAAGSVTGAGTSPFLNMSGTWNTTGAPDAIRLTVTNTASDAAANLMDLMIGAASLFAVRKDGRTTMAGEALIAGGVSPAIASIKVNVGAAAAQNVIRINGNSTADNAPVLDFLRSGNREWTFAPISNSFFISNSGGVANFNDATLNATPNWEFTSTGALKLNLGTVTTGLLHVNTNTTAAGLVIFEQASADTDSFDLSFRKTRGTVAVPTVITVGDQLGTILFRGYSGAGGYVTGASIRAVSTGTIATTRVASSLVFATGTDAAPTVLTDHLTLNNLGSLAHVVTSAAGTREMILTSSVSDAGNDKGGIVNGTSTDARFLTTFWGYLDSTNTASSFDLRGMVSAANDASDSSSNGVLHLEAFRTNNAADPNNGTLSDLVNRKLLTIGSTSVNFLTIAANGNTFLASGILEVRNSTTAQLARIYETADSGVAAPTNYSRISLSAPAGNHLIRTESAGTGTLRILQVGTGPVVGTDIAGKDSIFHGGQSTGTGLPGAILFMQGTPAGGTGSGVNALATRWSISTAGDLTAAEAFNIAFGTTTGTKIGIATTQKLAFWNKTPIIQPTNAIAAAAFVANTSGTLNDTATYGGYTIGQLAAALIATGILT